METEEVIINAILNLRGCSPVSSLLLVCPQGGILPDPFKKMYFSPSARAIAKNWDNICQPEKLAIIIHQTKGITKKEE